MPESGEVLEVIFQFIVPPVNYEKFLQPSMTNVEAKLFFEVADAAKKYDIYALKNICKTVIELQRQFTCPAEVLNFCYKYGYNEPINETAERALKCGTSTFSVTSKLESQELQQQWTRYHGLWCAAANGALDRFQRNMPYCMVWNRLYIVFSNQLKTNPVQFEKILVSEDDLKTKCRLPVCSCKELPDKYPAWFEDIVKMLKEFKSNTKFSPFIGR
ncbi:hypothetical protein BDN70DRAFT_936642 [Pholiota conissans]|uniref:Uncharacterized protein n=1 Tax=Pholiota conissans TaxID=109636 RepID=A0A9P5YRD4_9AGAR|nr:hypothetical protein BDN70DRAFT_936642 [Pholiota conissans]